MSQHAQQQHTTLYIALAFTAGIILTLGYKDVYPDLDRRYRQYTRRRRYSSNQPLALPTADHVTLQDHTTPSKNRRQSQLPPPSATSTTSTTTATTTAPIYEIREGVQGTIGNTPLIKIKSLSDATGCEILAKAEFLNGAGNSPKDRVALGIIDMAEEEGLLTPNTGDVIYEGTVGSTGISLAAICRARGYKAHM